MPFKWLFSFLFLSVSQLSNDVPLVNLLIRLNLLFTMSTLTFGANGF